MGMRRDVYNKARRLLEDALRRGHRLLHTYLQGGYRCRLFPSAWVYHKRRTDFRKFWRQVFNSGIARINLYKKYPESLKVVHLLPAVFTVGIFVLAILFLESSAAFMFVDVFKTYTGDTHLAKVGMAVAVAPVLLYSLLIFLDATWQYRSPKIGLLSIRAAFTQLLGYGSGFVQAWWRRCVGKDADENGEFEAYKKNFYK